MPEGFFGNQAVVAGRVSSKEGIEISTSARTLTAADRNKTIDNTGATAQVVLTLPAAEAGLRIVAVVLDTDGIQVAAATGDTIRIASSVSSAGGTATNAVIGSVLELVAMNDTQWIAHAVQGTWTLA